MKRKVTYLSPFFPKKLRKFIKECKRQKEIKAFKGNNVYCTVCGSQFRIFATYGVKNRENARCLNCNSLERHRLLWKYINEETDYSRRGKFKMLHFAPQRMFLSKFSKNPDIDYIPCDLNPETYEYYNISKIKRADVMKIPFEANSFDVVICNHVLEHIEDDILGMSELYRVMKKGGWGIFQVPLDLGLEKTFEDNRITNPNEREEVFGQYDHLRLYGRDYKERLASVGFKVTVDNYINRFSKEEIRRFGFINDEQIYFCKKL